LESNYSIATREQQEAEQQARQTADQYLIASSIQTGELEAKRMGTPPQVTINDGSSGTGPTQTGGVGFGGGSGSNSNGSTGSSGDSARIDQAKVPVGPQVVTPVITDG
jgi:hypothetical protein